MPVQSLRLRAKSAILKKRVGFVTPEHLVQYRSVAAPGAVGAVLFIADAPCKVVSGQERHATAGSGSSVVAIRKHAAGQVSAPAAAIGTGVTSILSTDIPADSTANTWQDIDIDTDAAELDTGDTLMVITPSTYAGFLVQLQVVYTGHPVGE